MPRILIHVGMPLCASLNLQTAFAQDPNIHYVGARDGGYANPVLEEFLRLSVPFEDSRLNPLPAVRDAFEAEIEAAGDRMLVISDEMLSSIGLAARGQSNSLPQIIENLRQAIGRPIEILWVIREQRAYLSAYYAHWVRAQGVCPFPEFLELALLRRQRFMMPALNYERLGAVMKGQVRALHMLVYERLMTDESYRRARLEALGLAGTAEAFPAEEMEGTPDADETEEIRRQNSADGTIWLDASESARRALYPEFYPERQPALEPAQTPENRIAALERRMRQQQRMDRNGVDGPERDIERTERLLEAQLRRMNRDLPLLDRETDWQALGYLIEERRRRARA